MKCLVDRLSSTARELPEKKIPINEKAIEGALTLLIKDDKLREKALTAGRIAVKRFEMNSIEK